jgi:phosphoribosylformylglycinamidine synthase
MVNLDSRLSTLDSRLMKFRVQITRRPGIADPEGSTTAHALQELGYHEVTGVHFGRDIIVEVEADDEEAATARVVEMCDRLLANPVIEDYTVERI